MWLLVVKFASLILLTRNGLASDAQCSPTWFDCGNGKCISEIWLCDGDNDCGNLKDEHECESSVVPLKCLSSQFACESDQHCIPQKWYCDGEKDCDDGSDEVRCNNATEECTGFTCRDHHCIPTKWYCDGNRDCADGSDEELCSPGKLCSDTEFLCSSGSCVNQSLVCDGKKDCADGSDEGSHCGDPCQNVTCSQNCKSTPSGPKCFCNDGYVLDAKDNKTCLDVNECLQEAFCSHQCTNTNGSYRCSCQNGYKLVNRTCQADGVDPLLIFSSLHEIRGMRLRSNKYFLIRRAISKASAVDVDPKSERVYWIEVTNRSSIYSAKTDGSDFKTILSHGLQIPEDIAVDYVANNLYLTDSGLKQVLVCKMDGTMCHVLHETNVDRPRSIVLDLDAGYLYWSDWGERSSGIYRSGMDGSRRVSFVADRIAWPNGIAIDHTTNRLYWADAKLNTIEYISLDGNTRKAILNATVFHPYSLAVFEDTIYWTDWSSFSLESCNKFTGHQMALMTRENGRHLMGVHVYHPVLTSTVSNPCWSSSDCSHMCVISPSKGYSCVCPHGFHLGRDGKTCTMTDYSEAIFVSESSSIFYMRPGAVGSNMITEIPLPPSTALISKVAFDRNLHYLFVADLSTPAIHAVNMTSSHMRVLVRSHVVSPEDLSFDWKTNNLYWIDSSKGTVEVISIDRLKRAIILENLAAPVSLAISPASGHMFVATVATGPSVAMYDMDGKNKRMLRSVQGVPISLALHPTKPILYWADPQAGTVSFVNYTSSRIPRILASRIDGVMSVAASEDSVYWTCRQRELNMLKGNTTYVLQLPGQEKGLVTRKVTYSARTIAGRSECLIGNGGCSYICLTSPNGKSCACPSELVLAEDKVSCIPRPCAASDFKCMSGECLPQELRCDGSNNCKDGSDEAGCNLCSGDDFQCKNGRCILKSWQCDRRNDCDDNSDEENCPVASACTHDQVACRNGECVSILWRCDGEPDCGDGTDELNCNATRCDSHQFRCDSGQCIPVSWLCDRSKDCFDNSDEKNCSTQPKTCTLHEFKCETDESCIDDLLKCDGREDCSDGSDEKNCPSSSRDCKSGMYRCKDGACIYENEVCDGHGDCKNEEDEMNCTKTSCEPEQLLCPSSKRCIPRRWICDGDEDCTEGTDEENCVEQRTQTMPTRAPLDSDCKGFYCFSSSQCLPWEKVCDGRQDCRELSDEGGLCSKSCFLNSGCSHICRKTPHGSQCECDEGYKLMPDNKTCEDIDECLEPGTCSHYCNNTKGSFKCICADGYFLHDHRHCKADGGPATLVYLLGAQIRGYNLSDKSKKVFVNLKNADMKGMDYDASNKIFFWTESNDGSINSYSPEGNRQDVIIRSPTRPVQVRYDWLAKNLYYRDESSRIVVCTVDGKYCRTLIQNSTTLIDSLDISPTSGLMFWTVWANVVRQQYTGLIERAEMDGHHRLVIISDKTVAPAAITVDHLLKMIYWTDKSLNTLECADFHGLQRRQVVQSKAYHPQAVAVFEDNIYWADWGTDSIMTCNKFIAENCSKIERGNVKANILMIVHKVMQPDGVNKCSNNNCSRLCLPTRSDHVCACDDADPTCESKALSASLCPKDYCQGGAECTVKNGEYVCKCPPSYSGKTCGVKAAVTSIAPMSASQCPEDYCEGDAECTVENGEYICKCPPSYSGKKCEVQAAVASIHSKYDYSWVVALVFAVVVAGVIVLGILLCIRNREKLQRMSEAVSVKFRSPKSGLSSRLVMDTDDGSLCEELVISPEGEYKRARGNSDSTVADSEESDLKKWPPQARDSPLLNNSVVNFFKKMKLNVSML